MSLGYIIALIIVLITITASITSVLIVKNRITPTIKQFNECQKRLTASVQFYTQEAHRLEQTLTIIQRRITVLQSEGTQKIQQLSDLHQLLQSLTYSLTYLKKHSHDYARLQAKDTLQTLKTDIPKLAKILKQTAVNTFYKQKQRYTTSHD